MTNELLKYFAEQAGGVVIAIFLIMRIEVKLDSLTDAIVRLTEEVSQPYVKNQN